MATLAYSNPLYDILPSFELQTPEDESNSATASVPVPKPRKSKTKVSPNLLNVDLKNDDDDDYANLPNNDKRESYSDFETTMQQIINDLDELSHQIKTEQRLSESVEQNEHEQESIKISETNIVQDLIIESPNNHNETVALMTKPKGRKKIEVKRQSIFKFSISSSSEISSPIPDDDPFDVDNDDVIADVECSNNNKINEIKSEVESPPPELPPRKPPRKLSPNQQIIQKENINKQQNKELDNIVSESSNISRKSPAFQMRYNPEYLNIEHLHETKIQLQRSGYLWKTGPNLKSFKLRWCILYRHSLEEADASLSYYFNRSSISASFSGKILLNDIEFISVTESVSSKTRLPKTNNDEKATFLEIGTRPRQGRVYLFAAKSDLERQCWMHSLTQSISLHSFENKDLYHVGFVRAKFTITAPWHYCLAILTNDRYLYMFQARTQARSNSIVKTVECKRYHAFNLRKTVKFSILDNKGAPVPVSENTKIVDCRFGFSLTQNGGSVVYIVTDYEHHNARWLRAVSHLWSIHDESDRCVLNEQYLTKQNIPVAIEKCLQFIETYSQSPSISALATLDSSEPMSNVCSMSICGQVIGELQRNAWQVHFLPAKFTCQQISLILLLFLRSMNECILTEKHLQQWINIGDSITNDWNKNVLIKIKESLSLLPVVNYHTLRRLVIHLASFCSSPNEPKLSNFLCKSFVFSKNKAIIVSLTNSRNILTKFIQNYCWLFEVSDSELAKEDRIRRAVNMLFNQNNNSDSLPISSRFNTASPSPSSAAPPPPSLSTSSSSTAAAATIPKTSENKCMKESMKTLIIGVKLYLNCQEDVKQTIINVHLTNKRTAQQVIENILDKNNKDVEIERYSLFEVVCANHLERIIMPNEPILGVVLNWSNWPASWANDASLELRITDSLLPHCSIQLERPLSSPNPKMLITVIKYCSNVENRSTKKILVELSNEALLLYTKDTNELIEEFRAREVYCYFGVESGNLFSGKTSVVVEDNHRKDSPILSASRMRSKTCPKSASRSFYRSSSSRNLSPTQGVPSLSESLPALTIVPKHLHEQRQCAKRLNFGHTFVFNSWPELEQWFNTILQIQILDSESF